MNRHDIITADCLDAMASWDESVVDSIVTDPPYGLKFMGKDWDHGVPGEAFWREALRVAKPGAHLLAFGGTRTFHRLACAIEDAGWEIRDCIMWVYGSGFPKSASVSKNIDREEQNKWLNFNKAIDNINQSTIMEAWKEHSRTASNAGLSFQSESPEAGPPTPSCDSVPASVLLRANPENSDALALLVELSSSEAPHSSEERHSVPSSAGGSERRDRAKSAESQPRSDRARPMLDGFARCDVKDWRSESTAGKRKAVEALKTWLGRSKSSSKADTAALCAALTDDLRLITLSRSTAFQSFDTTRQTACASAISVTITESTAASLISFTVDTLRREAIDKAAGAEREVKSEYRAAQQAGSENWSGSDRKGGKGSGYGEVAQVTAPATDAAKQWDGWGTALKPAVEPIILARKPFKGTVAANVLEHGAGALNIDGCRVGTDDNLNGVAYSNGQKNLQNATSYATGVVAGEYAQPAGRWPANLIHDGSDEVVGLFPNNAARFFYCAKASKKDRDDGNNHPTVKPTDLMRYLCRLITPPGGIVLDPFAGSGSTGKAAKAEGFGFIGIEKQAEYAEIARQRIGGAA